MKYNSNQDLRNFAIKLYTELNRNGEYDLSYELKLWNEEAFTSSSEFLGELMLILQKIYETSNLLDMKHQIEECITIIKKTFK